MTATAAVEPRAVRQRQEGSFLVPWPCGRRASKGGDVVGGVLWFLEAEGFGRKNTSN